MTAFRQNTFLSEIISGEPIPIGKLAYFRARLADRIYELVLEKYISLEETGFTKAELARRINRKPEQITRWFGSPGNWTIETVSDLLLGMGCEPTLSISSLSVIQTKNQTQQAGHALGSVVAQPQTGSINIEGQVVTPAADAASPSTFPTFQLQHYYQKVEHLSEGALTKRFGTALTGNPTQRQEQQLGVAA